LDDEESSEDEMKILQSKARHYQPLKYNEEDMLLYDVSNRKIYSVDDTRCPMIEVGTVISSEGDLWGNIQRSGKPSDMIWNFQNILKR